MTPRSKTPARQAVERMRAERRAGPKPIFGPATYATSEELDGGFGAVERELAYLANEPEPPKDPEPCN